MANRDDQISRSRVSSDATNDFIVDDVYCADGTQIHMTADAVHIRSRAPQRHARAKCCGLIPLSFATTSKSTVIPFRSVLWAEATSEQIAITYTRSISKAKIRPFTDSFPISTNDVKAVQTFVHQVQERAYGKAQRCKRIQVIINPFGGKGSAVKYWRNEIEPIFRAARCEIDVVYTTHHAHAEQIGEELDIEKVDVVACCSGDGVPYEIWNGLGRKKNARSALAKIAVVQLPCGTGNAMSINCNGTSYPSKAALAVVKGVRTRIDLASITQGNKRTLSFLSQCLGIVAESDLGTEHLRWLGEARFTVGFLKRILGKTVWPVDIAIGVEMADKREIEAEYKRSMELNRATQYLEPSAVDKAEEEEDEGLPPLRYGTIRSPLPAGWTMTPFPNLGNFYAGNMPFMAAATNFFPFARINDGLLDLITIRGDMSFLRALSLLLAVGDGKLQEKDVVNYRKVTGFRVIPRQPEGYVAVDGERYPFEGLQVEVHKALGCTLTPTGRYVRAENVE